MRDFHIEYGPQWTYVVAPWGRVSRFGKHHLSDLRNALMSKRDVLQFVAPLCRRPDDTGPGLARCVVRALQVEGLVNDVPFSCGETA